jgi:prepilin-type N-terminal cleavage/methylation domain-containing protein
VRRQGGFTLIELLIVVAVIAILAAILIPNFMHARSEAQSVACERNERHIATAMEEYAVDNNGSYTSTIPKLYLAATPKDPLTKLPYLITVPRRANGVYGAYEIQDRGGHDKTTLHNLNKAGVKCTTCTTVQYYQNKGLNGN